MTEVSARNNAGKVELDYILEFPTPVEAFCRVKEHGAAKYERGNWRKGGKPDHEYTSACLRHILAFKRGEFYADDSGCAHLAHAIWNLMALMELNYPGDVINTEVFFEKLKYWEDRKKAKENVRKLQQRAEDDSYEGG